MPTLQTLAVFAAATLSINLTPGPDMLFVLARSIGQGRGAGMISALGLSVGYLIYTLAAATGLAALLQSVPAAYTVIRVGGALYLAALGLRTIFRVEPVPAQDAGGASDTVHTGRGTLFRQGALTSTLNPSIAAFFLAFLPQFVDPARGAVMGQIVVLGLWFTASAVTAYTVLALLTGAAGDRLRGRAGSSRWQRWLSGGVLLVLGLRVLLQL